MLRKLAGAVTSLSLRLKEWKDWLLEVIVRVEAGEGSEGGNAGSREAILEILAVVIEQVARADLVGQAR